MFCLQQVHTVNTAIIPTYTARKDFLCCQRSAHQNMLSVERELMSCLLCANLSEINRPGCMKGLYVTKGSNGKFRILRNIMKGIGFLSNTCAIRVFHFQPFQGSEATQQGSCCLANVKSLFLCPFFLFFP